MSKKELRLYRDFIDSEIVFHVNFQLIINELLEKLQQKENIINKIEEYIKEGIDLKTGCGITREYIYAYENMLDKLQELKGSDK